MDAAGRAALNEDFLSVFKQIHPLAESSPLLTRVPILVHGSPVWRREVAVSVDQLTKIEVSQEPMGPATPNVMLFTSTTNVLTETAAVTMISEVTTSLRNVNKAIAKIASESKMVDAHIALNKKLSDTIKAGIGNLVDADMAAEVAQQKALEVKQQLGLQTLAIANSSAKSVLRLFA
jgi:flagellin